MFNDFFAVDGPSFDVDGITFVTAFIKFVTFSSGTLKALFEESVQFNLSFLFKLIKASPKIERQETQKMGKSKIFTRQ